MVDYTVSETAPNILPHISRFAHELTALRRDFHRHPEIGFEEVRTSQIVADHLGKWGIQVHRGYGKTGVVGILKGKHVGNRSIGLRADMDALPMPEETGLDYASIYPGKFHGCGHDAHTAILLGAARYLAETREFSGTVTFIFQPAEEGLGGARAMIADGLFRDFPVDEIYGLHNTPATASKPNHLRVSHGPVLAGADFFDISFKGKGAHAAHPEVARDPIPAIAELIQALQTIVSRNVAPIDAAVLTITKVNAGSAYNVIPEVASIAGTVRAFSEPVRTRIRERIRAIAEGLASAHDLLAQVKIEDKFSVLTNDAAGVEHVAAVAREVLGPDRVSTQAHKALGSEDFADFLQHAPGAFFTLGHKGDRDLHNPGFVIDDDILPVGATLFARLIESRLAPE